MKLPALDNVVKSTVLLDNLNALHAARQAFISAESSERIRRALKAQTRTSTSLIFQNGQSVYYKREGLPAWKGPGTVIGKEGQTIIVKHGSIYVRVHPSRLIHENSEFSSQEENAGSKDNNDSRLQDVAEIHEHVDSDSGTEAIINSEN